MRRHITLMICFLAVLGTVILGILLSGILGGKLFAKNAYAAAEILRRVDDMELYFDETFSMNEIRTIKLSLSAGEMNVFHSEDGSLRVVQRGDNLPDSLLVEARQIGSGIRIKPKGGFSFYNIFNFFRQGSVRNKIDVYIPASYAGDFDIGVSAGNITIGDEFRVAKLHLTVSAGKLSSQGILFADEATANVSSGGMDLSGLAAASFELRTSAGNLDVGELSGSGRISTSAGSIDVRRLEIEDGGLEIKTSAGSVHVALAGEPSLDFRSRISAGSVRTYFEMPAGKSVNIKIGGGPYKKLDVSASAGDIRISQAV